MTSLIISDSETRKKFLLECLLRGYSNEKNNNPNKILLGWWWFNCFEECVSFRKTFKNLFIYLFGCIRSYLWHTGSSLHHERSFVYTDSLVVVPGFSSMALRLSCFMPCRILVPQPGLEPMSPALQGGFLTTGPPGKSLRQTFISNIFTVEFLISFESSDYEMMLNEQ